MGTRNGSNSGMMMVPASEEECDVGLGLRMQQPRKDDDFSREKTTPMMMMSMPVPPHHHHHHHPYHQQHMLSPSSSGRGAAAGEYYGGVGGSIFSGARNHHLACVDEEAAAATLLASGSASDSSSSAAPAPVFNSSGKMAASANARVPFTAAQWQEMERQTMILKHMMTSAPVPPELLLPITKSPPTVLPYQSNRGSDPEPWRCRRTDGKKWRCSRDVAPHQKYCERHSHKNRPRSRKPVELQADYTNTTNNIKKSNVTTTNSQSLNSCQNPQFLNLAPNPPSLFPTTVASAYDQPRGLEWFMKGETISNQEDYHHQQQPMHANCNRIDPFHLKQPHMPLGSYSDYGSTHELHETRHFIDAWSTPHRDDSSNRAPSVSAGKKMPISSLSLTMCGIGEEDSKNTDMGVGLMGREHEKSGDLRPPHWMISPGESWMGSTTPGGPLAEALCLGTANASSATMAVACEASPNCCIGVTSTSSRSPSKDEGHELNLIS
ncbi:growth-regulating factor 8 [Syzygium oleosum]|uniref:growth-regulating factor 8 n=1 Tax=Syzygium oleosum TaxID=219896 RepID=UPI0011D1D28B|nr:growth-regulating factor 8 [Syzygium oleosum]